MNEKKTFHKVLHNLCIVLPIDKSFRSAFGVSRIRNIWSHRWTPSWKMPGTLLDRSPHSGLAAGGVTAEASNTTFLGTLPLAPSWRAHCNQSAALFSRPVLECVELKWVNRPRRSRGRRRPSWTLDSWTSASTASCSAFLYAELIGEKSASVPPLHPA